MGFEFDGEDDREAFKKTLRESPHDYEEIRETVLGRIL